MRRVRQMTCSTKRDQRGRECTVGADSLGAVIRQSALQSARLGHDTRNQRIMADLLAAKMRSEKSSAPGKSE